MYINIKLDKEEEEQLKTVKKTFGVKSNSEVVRLSLYMLFSDTRSILRRDQMRGSSALACRVDYIEDEGGNVIKDRNGDFLEKDSEDA